jgi:hypothetical protein
VSEPLATILAPAYLESLRERPLADIRAMRDLCQQVEGGLSYVRRLAHGRLDIVGGELSRRREGGDPKDIAALVARLPELLSDDGNPPRVDRSPRHLEWSEPPPDLVEELDEIVQSDDLGDLSARDDAALTATADQLVQFERWISDRRHKVHGRIDSLQDEIARRYRDGEASVDSILS